MIKHPLVSILMTAYNREKYIGEAIESVLASSYKNFELIIVDDCSKDSTVTIARHYESTDARVKVYVNEKNLGDYPNRNQAASLASGKYLKYVDSDDMIYPHGLEVMVSAMEDHSSVGLCICSQIIQHKTQFPILIPVNEALKIHFFENGFLNIGPTGVIIRKDVFDLLTGFTGKRMVGDTELWLRIACHYPILISFPSLAFWRKHDGQEFFDGVRSGLYSEMNLKLLRELTASPDCTLTEEEKRRVLKFNAALTARDIIKRLIFKREFSKMIRLNRELSLVPEDYFNGLFRLSRIK